MIRASVRFRFRDPDDREIRDYNVLASPHDQAYVRSTLHAMEQVSSASQLPAPSFQLPSPSFTLMALHIAAGRTARSGCYTGLSDLVTAASPLTPLLRYRSTGAASDRVERHSRT